MDHPHDELRVTLLNDLRNIAVEQGRSIHGLTLTKREWFAGMALTSCRPLGAKGCVEIADEIILLLEEGK